MDNFSKLKDTIGRTVEKVIDISVDRQERFQLNFSDGSKLILKSNAHGYDIKYEEIEVEFYE